MLRQGRDLSVEGLLRSNRWVHGPDFLWKNEDEWPKSLIVEEVPDDDVEVKNEKLCDSLKMKPVCNIVELLFLKISNWHKLKKTVAWLLRFKAWFCRKFQTSDKSNEEIQMGRITVKELQEAEKSVLVCIQHETFPEEIKLLNSQKPVKKSSPLYRLDTVIISGLLCIGGRLKNKPYGNDESRHPVILPKNNQVSDIIILYFHQISAHSGQEYVLSLLRKKYWIIEARLSVRRLVRSYFDCKRRCEVPDRKWQIYQQTE